MAITEQPFGTTGDGTTILGYTLSNGQGLEATIMTYGGILVALRTPDRHGQLADVTLGFDTLAPYLGDHAYFGALIGRYGNRIAHGTFQLQGQTYHLARNNGPNHLHGGLGGFDKRIWQAQPDSAGALARLQLTYLSRDGDEGFPGNLQVTVVYTLTADNALRLDYSATTDQATVVNLTNHTYFNLGDTPDILAHELQIAADYFLPVDATLIPTGELAPVAGTPLDFRRPTAIGARIQTADPQLQRAAGGYDHTWVLDGPGSSPSHAAQVYDPSSGRVLDVYTTQPGVQFYSGNMLDGTLTGKGGRRYGKHSGLCLETQHFPDSPNQPQFPSTVVAPGATYRQTTLYQFSVR
ncbi:MAG: galactose mutarotase [Chloroflexota bacterium]|nr:galactose mutarotase [Chloroflexota bacterium]